MNDDQTKVTVFKTKKDGEVEQKLFERTFHLSETKEIQLFGLEGRDQFKLSGSVDKGIKIRIVGGEDEDKLVDQSLVKGLGKKTIFYDSKSERNEIDPGRESRVRTSKKDWVNAFETDCYSLDYLGPRFSLEFNPDDGLFLGAGVFWKDQGFRKEPGSDHLLTFNHATRTSGFNAAYTGNIYAVPGQEWHLSINANGHNAKYAFNYFGQGNSTSNTNNIDFYRVSLSQFNLSAVAVKKFNERFSVGFGPTYQYAEIDDVPNTILGEPLPNQAVINTEAKFMLGGRLFMDMDFTDHPAHPSKGVRWRNEITYLNELNGSDVNFGQLNSELSFYYTPEWPFRMTIASRFGVSQNIGDFLLYQSNFLGGQETLRGFRRSRFAGKGSAYLNTEIRLSLFNIHNILLNGEFGILGFVDHGRVWTDGVMESNDWHRTYGPGVYLQLYDNVVISGHYGITEEEQNFFQIRGGFLF